MLNSVSVIGRLQGDPKKVEVGDKTKVVFYMKHWSKLFLDTIHVKNYRYISVPLNNASV